MVVMVEVVREQVKAAATVLVPAQAVEVEQAEEAEAVMVAVLEQVLI